MMDPRDLHSAEMLPLLQKQEPTEVSKKKVSDERQETKNAVKKVVPRLEGPPGGYAMGSWIE